MKKPTTEICVQQKHYQEIEKIVAHSLRFDSVEDFITFLLQCYLEKPISDGQPTFLANDHPQLIRD